jgi:hypothetical protein
VRGRIAASIVLAASVALGIAGCDFIAPQATTKHYDASDGVSGNVGDIAVRNALLITRDGTPANLVVTLVNTGDKSHRVLVESTQNSSKGGQYVTVEPGQSLKVGSSKHPRVVFTKIDAKPGTLHKVFFQYGSQTGLQLLVPVLTGKLDSYSTLTPTPHSSGK